MKKILVIRFSSFGDVIQSMNAARELKYNFPDCEITWVSKLPFSEILNSDSAIDKVFSLETDFEGSIFNLYNFLRLNKFDLIYDAHKNLRTSILKLLLFFSKTTFKWVERPKSRLKRLLLFKFRKNLFPNPFFSKVSYIKPLEGIIENIDYNRYNRLTFPNNFNDKFTFLNDRFIVFAPSAAWEMKRWPEEHWKKIIKHYSRLIKVILVGGPGDKFISKLYERGNDNVINLSGKLSYFESVFLVSKAEYTLSADTGIIHCADLIGARGGVILGPTAFGRTHSKNIQVFEVNLDCKPCTKDGRGKCTARVYQQCMREVTPDILIQKINISV